MESVLRFTINVDCSAFFCFLEDEDIAGTPDKKQPGRLRFAGCFLLFKERTGHPAGAPPGIPRAAPAGCRGSRNEMLSPGKGKPWATDGQGTDSRHPEQNTISILYIPQFLPRGQRYCFIRHISIFSPDSLQKNTLFSHQAYRLCGGCAFFAP